ncbi:hypothetical protein [Bradyrhizobium sp. CCBAU 51627]|uniref:hypothetical protein n=1 Tax=Bradyrhizobium sp. CCBAU 51627 TaxID=1325088 RepID=UPI002304E834|nr:hypothetical protein [Bradyrhizobium sp. CCBAU 51627]
MLLPDEPVPSSAVHVVEELHGGWLEHWYQSKIDASGWFAGAARQWCEMRHPTSGAVPPAYFIIGVARSIFSAPCPSS